MTFTYYSTATGQRFEFDSHRPYWLLCLYMQRSKILKAIATLPVGCLEYRDQLRLLLETQGTIQNLEPQLDDESLEYVDDILMEIL